MTATPRVLFIGLLTMLAAASATTFTRQAATPGDFRMTPVSELSPEWFYHQGVSESNNGRFVAMVAGDFSLTRYDRRSGNWTAVREVKISPQVAWSPDGRFLAAIRRDPAVRGDYLWLVPMDTVTGLPNGTARRISTSMASFPAWSPDGRRVAFISRDSTSFRILAVPFNGGDEQVLYRGVGYRRFLAWSPDGQYLLSGEGTARPPNQLRVNTRTLRADTLPAAGNVLLGVSPDGRRVAHRDQLTNIVTVSAFVDGKVLQRVRLPRDVDPLGWSRTTAGAFIGAQSIASSRLLRVSLPDGAVRDVTPIDSAATSQVAYSPDGRLVSFVRRGPVTASLQVMDADGSNRRTLVSLGNVEAATWSPTGTHLAFRANGDTGSIRVVNIASGQTSTLAQAAGDAVLGTAVAWRSDGQAVRYIWRPRGAFAGDREAREVTLSGQSGVLAPAPIPQGDVLTNRQTEPHFVNDTLLLLRNGQGVSAVHLRTGTARTLYSGRMRPRNEFGVSRDGEWIAFAAWDGDKSVPTLVSLRTGEQRRVPYGLGAELGPIFFHPDGRHLVAPACLRCTIEKFDIVMIPMNGDPTRVLTSSLSSYVDFWDPAVAPDGRSIVFMGDLSWSSRLVTLTLPTSP